MTNCQLILLNRSVLGPWLLLIYVNNSPDGLKSICKIFADDASLYSKINDIDTSNTDINNDLVKISRQAYQWKMLFNPDINRQTTEVYLFQRHAKSLPPPIIFNNSNVLTSPHQKHLGLVLDSKLGFSEYVNQKINKCNRILGLIKNFLNNIKETIAYNLQNICKVSFGLCRHNL